MFSSSLKTKPKIKSSRKAAVSNHLWGKMECVLFMWKSKQCLYEGKRKSTGPEANSLSDTSSPLKPGSGDKLGPKKKRLHMAAVHDEYVQITESSDVFLCSGARYRTRGSFIIQLVRPRAICCCHLHTLCFILFTGSRCRHSSCVIIPGKKTPVWTLYYISTPHKSWSMGTSWTDSPPSKLN